MSGSLKRWYEKFLRTLTVQTIIPSTSNENVFYALHIQIAEFKQLHSGEYEFHLFFYDTVTKQFFGKHITCKGILKENYLRMDPEILFFHTAITENRIVIICEIIKLDNNPWVYAWTAVPLLLHNHALTEYNSQLTEIAPLIKYKLYNGSCVYLTYMKDLDELDKRVKKINGILHASIQLHTAINDAVSYVPENFFVTSTEKIPGLHFTNKGLQLDDAFTALVDNAILVQHMSVEKVVSDMLMHDYCLRMNKPKRDCDAKRFSIIERRLKIGVHNGFCYVEEPHYIFLHDRDEFHSNRATFRRRSRSIGRNVGGTLKSSQAGEFVARNCVRLTRLCASELYAIIFSVDFLVGFCDKDDSIRQSQWVMIAWNAWCPFYNNAFTIADTITVPLVGGPRPNPDDLFCFKNLINRQQFQNQRELLGAGLFAEEGACFNLKFNFAVVEATNSSLLMMLPAQRQSYISRKTPSPNPDLPPLMSPISPVKWQQCDQESEVNAESFASKTIIESLAVTYCKDNTNETVLKRTQSVPLMETKPSYSKLRYIEDNKDKSVSGYTRSVSHHFANFNFQPVISAEEWQVFTPTPIDPLERRKLDVETEVNAFLPTNEIVLQFVAIQNISNQYYDARQRRPQFFFTFQFYRFGIVTTERLRTCSGSHEWKPEMPLVFQRIDDDGVPIKDGIHGFTVRFIVHKLAIPLNDSDDFARYLMEERLHIDVWDADSLIHVGACALPLHVLCRQNSSAVTSELQCTIVEDGLADSDRPVTSGLLYMRVANIGRPADKKSQTVDNSGGFTRVCRQHNSERFCQRARPLHAIHDNALQRFLSAQKLDLYQRKEELFSNDSLHRVERWNEIKKHSPTLMNAPMKRFIFREELEVYKTLRSESKASALLRAVFRGITTRYTVHTKYGQVEFFEFLLRNTFAEQIFCVVDINDPRLRLVLNPDEWKFYKDCYHLRTPLERDLFSVEEAISDGDGPPRVVLLLGAMESVCVPLKFDNTLAAADGIHRSVDARPPALSEIRAIFKRADTDEPIGILEVAVQNRDVAVSKVLRLFCEENRKVSRVIPWRGNQQVAACRVSLPSVHCSLRKSSGAQQEIHFSCNIGHSPDVQNFFLMFYAGQYFTRQLAIWKISLHSMRRLDVHGIQGQLTKIALPLRSTLTDENCSFLRLFASSAALTFQPSQTLANEARLLDNAHALFVPNFTGQRIAVVNAVDVQANRLLLSWLIYATVGEPNIVKVYDVKVPARLDAPVSKKIDVTNAYGVPKHWRVHTSNEQLVAAAKEYHLVEPQATASIELYFKPATIEVGSTTEVLVFVEDAEIAQQEEAYALKITYVAR